MMEGLSKQYTAQIMSLKPEDVCPKLDDYLDVKGLYASFSFDMAGDNPPFALTGDDLLALNFLSVPLGPLAYRQIISRQHEMEWLLLQIDPRVSLWQMNVGDATWKAANEVWQLLLSINGIAETRASKLMARKRPHLIPILDKWVRRFFGTTDPFWEPLSAALANDRTREHIESLRPDTVNTSQLSLLRILDIAIWMTKGKPPASEDTGTIE